MGTKKNPGQFDCYAKANDDEPMFILLGRDPCSMMTVLFWSQLREEFGMNDRPQQNDTLKCASDMLAYLEKTDIQKFIKAIRCLNQSIRALDSAMVMFDFLTAGPLQNMFDVNEKTNQERRTRLPYSPPTLRRLSPEDLPCRHCGQGKGKHTEGSLYPKLMCPMNVGEDLRSYEPIDERDFAVIHTQLQGK